MKLTFAFCTYNRANRLENLVAAMRAQKCPIPFEILAINKINEDYTLSILEDLAARPDAILRYVTVKSSSAPSRFSTGSLRNTSITRLNNSR